MFSQLFIAAVLAVSAQSAVAATCSRSYTVQEGDYCDKISQAQNVSTYQLAVLNSDAVNSACTNLLPGQVICLAANADENCKTTYVVLKDDTCDGIASKNGLNSTLLSLNNPQINEGCSNIYIGEVLCTSKTVQVAPIPAKGVTVVAPVTTFVVKPTTTPAAAVAATPAAAATTPKATPTPAPAASADSSDDNCEDDNTTTTSDDDECDDDSSSAGNDEDDDDLPFCDEL